MADNDVWRPAEHSYFGQISDTLRKMENMTELLEERYNQYGHFKY